MRLFIALEVPDSIRQRVSIVSQQLRASVPAHDRLHWVPPNQFHLTLKFLGECENALGARLQETLEHVATRLRGFSLTFRHLGCFPERGNPSVLWIGTEDGQTPCRSLADAVEACCEPLGFKRETRAYHAHLTLARIKETRNGRAFRDAIDRFAFEAIGPVPIEQISLVRSVLTPSGSQYTTLFQTVLPPAATV